MDTITVGLVEDVTLLEIDKTIQARIDTGATMGSIDTHLAKELKSTPCGHKLVKSSHGTTRRDIIEAEILLEGKKV